MSRLALSVRARRRTPADPPYAPSCLARIHSKTTVLLKPHKTLLDDRYSEREERREHGRLRTQAEQEAKKAGGAAAAA